MRAAPGAPSSIATRREPSGAFLAGLILAVISALLLGSGSLLAASANGPVPVSDWLAPLLGADVRFQGWIPQRLLEAGDLTEFGAAVLLAIAVAQPLNLAGRRLPAARTLDERHSYVVTTIVVLLLAGTASDLLGHFSAGPVFAVGAAMVWGGAWLLRRVPARELVWLLPTLALALAIRLGLAVALHLHGVVISPRAIVLDGESAYDLAAQALIGAVKLSEPTNGNVLPRALLPFHGPYSTLLMAAYWLFGPAPMTGRILGAVIGAGAVLFAAASVRATYGRATALAAGPVMALLPGLFGWSPMLLPDATVTLLLAALLWGSVSWAQHRTWAATLLVGLCLHLLAQLSPTAAATAAATLLVAIGWRVITSRVPAARAWYIGLVAAGGLLLTLLWFGTTVSPAGFRGLLAVVVSPLNAGTPSASYLLLDVEAAVWLLVLAGAVVSWWSRRDSLGGLLLLYVWLGLLAQAQSNANPGNLTRERAAQCLLAAAVAAAPLLARMRRRWTRPRHLRQLLLRLLDLDRVPPLRRHKPAWR